MIGQHDEGRDSTTRTIHPRPTVGQITEGTTMTTTLTPRTLPHPMFTIREGQVLAVVPGEGPLLRWLTSEDALGQHPDYDGTYRPTEVTVVRVARSGHPSSNVRVRFHVPVLRRDVETWVHHSFLVDPSAPVVDPVTAQVAAVSAFMFTDIGRQEWPGAGTPTGWLGSDRATWFTAGNLAVLTRRAEIEAGSVTAGAVWCRAARGARSFSYTPETEAFLHEWFVTHREYLSTLMASAQVEAPAVVRQRIAGIRQGVWLSDNRMGLVLPAAVPNGTTITVYQKEGGNWRDQYREMDSFRFAVAGDRIRNTATMEGAVYEAEVNDSNIRATLANGLAVTWDRESVVFVGDPATVPPAGDITVTVDGIEYVRKDVIDRDIATFTGITHRKSVDHSLCGVYDETQREVDAATEYIKMGARYKDYDVSVEQTLVVRRTFRVERALDGDAAIESARRIARDYDLNTVTPRRTGETVRVLRTEPVAATEATARVVN